MAKPKVTKIKGKKGNWELKVTENKPGPDRIDIKFYP